MYLISLSLSYNNFSTKTFSVSLYQLNSEKIAFEHNSNFSKCFTVVQAGRVSYIRMLLVSRDVFLAFLSSLIVIVAYGHSCVM